MNPRREQGQQMYEHGDLACPSSVLGVKVSHWAARTASALKLGRTSCLSSSTPQNLPVYLKLNTT